MPKTFKPELAQLIMHNINPSIFGGKQEGGHYGAGEAIVRLGVSYICTSDKESICKK